MRDAPPDVSGRVAAPPACVFGETVDPRLYVPRAACERVRTGLASALAAGRGPVAVVSPPGLGKTLQLRIAAATQADAREPSAYLPYGALAFDELAAWVLGRIGAVQDATASPDALRDLARRGLRLFIDDADSLPRDTARALSTLSTECKGRFRLALTTSDDARGSRMLAAFGPDLEVLRLSEPMTAAETRDYVLGRMRAGGLGDHARRAFDAAAIERIHGLAAGNPRRVNELCAQLVEGGFPDDVESSRRDHHWLGTPLDED